MKLLSSAIDAGTPAEGEASASATRSLAKLVSHANAYADAARSPNTRRAYRTDWLAFEAWCEDHRVGPLPASPDAVALYLTYLADEGLKVATIERALAAISQAHKFGGYPSPRSAARVMETRRGIRRTLGVAQTAKAPVIVEHLRTMVKHLPEGVLGQRDRALLVLGFAGAFRRSELVALDVPDLAFTEAGLEVTIRRSKTDQEGEGRKLGVPYGSDPTTCPVRVTRAWLKAAEITTGAVFRSINRYGKVKPKRLADRVVALVVKRYASAAGLGEGTFAGHSLRAGLATSAAKAGKSERAIMAQTGHRSSAMVRRYIRDAELFTDENAVAGLL